LEYRKLGQFGPEVSIICLGAMNFGSQTDEETVVKIFDHARNADVNFIDTADIYADGKSEESVGVAIASDRENWIVASKVGFRTPSTSADVRLNDSYIRKSLDGSLARLGTEYLDLYYLHAEDPRTTISDTLATIGNLIEEKLIRGFGLSNFSAWKIAEVCGLCDHLGIPNPMAYQPCYNLLTRYVEVEAIIACAHFGIGVVPYSPLARGVLTGKYSLNNNTPNDSRAARAEKRFIETEYRPESIRIAEIIKHYAELRGTTATNFALNWVLNNSQVVSAISGPRTFEQWKEYLHFSEFNLNADDENFVNALVAPGHASTHYFTDPNFPVVGRRTRS
jgi:aryl-alcohol dehydrogenase-like predicted oxidoreductase